ncbi:hypothetical protein JTP67_36240, partial [Streptomyces sp. S12]|nr:hypothetical protein [Streptomyces sp. S12]
PAVQKYAAQHTQPGRLVSNGAYRLAAWTPQANLVVEKNPNFHDAARVALPRVRFHVTEDAAAELQRFAAGDLHITEVVPPQPLAALRERFGEQLRLSPYLGAFWFGLNTTQPPFRPACVSARRSASACSPQRALAQAGRNGGWVVLRPNQNAPRYGDSRSCSPKRSRSAACGCGGTTSVMCRSPAAKRCSSAAASSVTWKRTRV